MCEKWVFLAVLGQLAPGRQRLEELGLTPPKLKRLTVAQCLDREGRESDHRAVEERRSGIKQLANQHGTKYGIALRLVIDEIQMVLQIRTVRTLLQGLREPRCPRCVNALRNY